MPKTGLTSKQRQIAFTLANEPFLTQNKVAEKCDTSTEYICKLKKRADFQEYFQQVLDELWKEAGYKARKQMQQLADSGDYRAVEFICKTNSLNPSTKVEGEINTNLVITITGEEDGDKD